MLFKEGCTCFQGSLWRLKSCHNIKDQYCWCDDHLANDDSDVAANLVPTDNEDSGERMICVRWCTAAEVIPDQWQHIQLGCGPWETWVLLAEPGGISGQGPTRVRDADGTWDRDVGTISCHRQTQCRTVWNVAWCQCIRIRLIIARHSERYSTLPWSCFFNTSTALQHFRLSTMSRCAHVSTLPHLVAGMFEHFEKLTRRSEWRQYCHVFVCKI